MGLSDIFEYIFQINHLVFLLIGTLASFLSGLLCVGGAGFLLPLLIYGPPLLGGEKVDMSEASALCIGLIWISTLAAALSMGNILGHKSVRPLIITLAIPAAAFGFLGSILSASIHELVLAIVFPVLLLASSSMMLLKPKKDEFDINGDQELEYSLVGCFFTASFVGFFAGMSGAGGGFLLTPLSIYLLQIPTRVALACGLPVVFASSTTTLAGKIISDQMVWDKLLFLVIPSIPMAKLGAACHKKTKPKILRTFAAFLFITVALGMITDIVYHHVEIHFYI
ncbi:hypothetical protein P9112_006081 [Eukaryota sp. TZLM1-RC]